MPKNGPFWRVFEKLKLAVKQCSRQISFNKEKIGGKCQNSKATFWVIFKQCVSQSWKITKKVSFITSESSFAQGSYLVIFGVKIQIRHILVIFKRCEPFPNLISTRLEKAYSDRITDCICNGIIGVNAM